MDRARISQICGKDETTRLAQKLLGMARPRTAQGSGFDLEGLRAHLPIFCAYIASESLRNSDVSLQTAQGAACLSKSDFAKGLGYVQGAIKDAEESGPRKTRSSTGGFYNGLLNQYKLTHVSGLEEAMRLTESRVLSLLEVKDAQAKHVRVAIFYWVFSLHKTSVVIDWDRLVANEEASPQLCKKALAALEKKGGFLANQIKAGVSRTTTPLPGTPTTPRKSPSKTPSRVIPVKPSSPLKTPSRSPAKSSPSLPLPPSPSKTPKRVPPTGDKRKAAPDPDSGDESGCELILRSPKKQKLEPASSTKRAPSEFRVPLADTPSRKRTASVVMPKLELGGGGSGVEDTPSKRRTVTKKPIFGVGVGGVDIDMDKTPTRTNGRIAPTPKHIPSTVTRPLFSTTTPRRAITQDSPVRQRVFIAEPEEEEEELEEDVEVEEDEPARRFRPVFLDGRQWKAKDPRVEVLWKRAEENKARLVAKYGNPFAKMRPSA